MRNNNCQILLFIFSVAAFQCCQRTVDPGTIPLIANAGSDQITIIGSYAILDASQSQGEIDWYEWEQDNNNPEEVKIFSGNDSWQYLCFYKEGTYKFRLTVKSGLKASKPDEVTIAVNKDSQKIFKDFSLEIAVRFTLKQQSVKLTNNMLLSLDSLRFFDGAKKITFLDGLELCSSLKYLQLGHQKIIDISPLASLTGLKIINLTQNRTIQDITPLTGLTELEWLNLSDNLITDISSLKQLTNLKYLNLNYNIIDNIQVLKNMKELRQLWMFDANLNNLYELSNLTKLELLWLTRCNIEDISHLANLTNMKSLKLAFNQITDISALSKMEKLDWLALEMNNISEILPLKDLSNIHYVRLWDNKITSIKPLVDNPSIGKGDTVGLNNNPLDETSLQEYIPILQTRGVNITW